MHDIYENILQSIKSKLSVPMPYISSGDGTAHAGHQRMVCSVAVAVVGLDSLQALCQCLGSGLRLGRHRDVHRRTDERRIRGPNADPPTTAVDGRVEP